MLSVDRQHGTLVGLTVGDAIGAAIEFETPGTFPEVTGYRGGGPHGLAPGEWTDDSSMALALADSIASVGWDLNDQARRYVAWWQKGEYSVNHCCFDIGFTTRRALSLFERTGDARTSGDPSERASGNGSIMRLAPVPIRYCCMLRGQSEGHFVGPGGSHGFSQVLELLQAAQLLDERQHFGRAPVAAKRLDRVSDLLDLLQRDHATGRLLQGHRCGRRFDCCLCLRHFLCGAGRLELGLDGGDVHPRHLDALLKQGVGDLGGHGTRMGLKVVTHDLGLVDSGFLRHFCISVLGLRLMHNYYPQNRRNNPQGKVKAPIP